jgi:hypothetical protein
MENIKIKKAATPLYERLKILYNSRAKSKREVRLDELFKMWERDPFGAGLLQGMSCKNGAVPH